MAARRRVWKAAQLFIDPDKLVFLDETGVNTKMARLYGWARSASATGTAPPSWKTMTFVAGLRVSGITAPWLLDGPMNGQAFRVYVQEVLAPSLSKGDILGLDNLPAHKVAGIREAVAERRAQIFYLPPYSPDMNPIEMAFSKLKALLRHDPARTVNDLVDRIGKLLDRFPPTECASFFNAALIVKML